MFKRSLSSPSLLATATAAAGAATCHGNACQVTSEALTTVAQANYTLTVTNGAIQGTTDQVLASVKNGSNTQGTPVITKITPTKGQVVIVLKNDHATEALNGTMVFDIDVKNIFG